MTGLEFLDLTGNDFSGLLPDLSALLELLNLDLNQISIKATTTEKMGPLGNKEGLGAIALVNII